MKADKQEDPEITFISFGDVFIEDWESAFTALFRSTGNVIDKLGLLPRQTDIYSRKLFTLLLTDRL